MTRLSCMGLTLTLLALVGCGKTPTSESSAASTAATAPPAKANPVVNGLPMSRWVELATQDQDIGGKFKALEVITRFSVEEPDVGAPYMLELMEKDVTSDYDVSPSEKLMPMMLQCLKHQNGDIRIWGVKMLGNLRGKAKRAIPALQQAWTAAKAREKLRGFGQDNYEQAWIEQAIDYINGKEVLWFPL